MLQQDKEMTKKQILKQHKYKITYNEGDNRWHTYIPDDSRPNKRKPVAKRKKEDMEDYLVQFYKEQEETSSRKTFQELFPLVQEKKLQYIKGEEKLISAKNTQIKAFSDYRRYFSNTAFEAKYMDAITKKDIEEICYTNLQRYDMKAKAFASLKGILKQVFDYAFSEYLITDNVFQRVDFKLFHNMLVSDIPVESRVHSPEEVSAILNEIHNKEQKRPSYSSVWALELQILMGTRRGELPPLTWKDVENNFISITKEQLTSQNNTFVVVGHTKNKKDRCFPMTNDIADFLERLKAMHNKYYPDSKYLFPATNKTGIITNRAVYSVYQKICKKLGIEKEEGIIKGPHSFRRNAITDVVNATNGNIIMASALFGNSPEVAKNNYYTGANMAVAAEILNKRKLLNNQPKCNQV